jgi:hypothetical protein
MNIIPIGFPKVIVPGSFDWDEGVVLSSLVDDPDVFRKTASSQVVDMWGPVESIPGHSIIHLIALSDFEKTGCFFEGAPVQTDRGFEPIEEIVEGDLVLTHKNRFRRVVRTFTSEYSGDRVSIKVCGLPVPSVSTGNHPFTVIRKKDFAPHFRCPSLLALGSDRDKTPGEMIDKIVEAADFVEARDVKVGDFMVVPINPEPVESRELPFDWAYIMGVYLAEGCVGREYRDIPTRGKIRKITLAMAKGDTESIERVGEVASQWGYKLDIQPSNTSDLGLRVSLSHNEFAAECHDLMGEGAASKFLSPLFFAQSDEWKLNFLAGYFDGDGCLTTNARDPRFENVLRANTASMNLALDLQRLMAGMGIMSSVSPGMNRESNGCFGLGDLPIFEISVGGAYSAPVTSRCSRLRPVRDTSGKGRQARCWASRNYMVFRVTSVESEDVANLQRFNLEVEEDNTYVTTVAGHNSNRNGDAFESLVCQRLHPTFIKRAKLYRGHKTGPAKGETPRPGGYEEGYVIKSAHNGEMGRTELLVAASHAKCADWLGELEAGDPVAFSMGFNCFYDECSICDHKARTPEYYCEHVKKEASAPYGMGRILADGRKCFVFNRKGFFNDISKVGTGADMTAFDLRKVASLAQQVGHVPSGAELGEMYIYKTNYADPRKLAVAQKLSVMEKRIPAMAKCIIKEDEVEEKTASDLISAPSPADMFTYLSEHAILLPCRQFFKVALAGDYQEMADDIDVVRNKLAAEGGFTWAIRNGLLDKIASNDTYNRKPATTFRVHSQKEARLLVDHSYHGIWRDSRENRKVAQMAVSGKPPVAAGELTPKQAALACEYLAYKLSAVESIPLSLNTSALASMALQT